LRRDICPAINGHGTAHFAHPIPCGSSGDSSFLFIPDLTNKATGAVLVALIILYVGSQMASTLLMSTTTDRTQRLLFLALPFLFVTFVIRFPAGLLVYWITTNFWTIAQQWIIRRRLGPLRPATAPGDSAGGLFAGLGGFGARSQSDNGERREPKAPAKGPAPAKGRELAKTGAREQPKGRTTGRPPAPPRKKKKRSGRRR
jgi:YidC/Oxa1 family membrane protein insertase